MRKVLLGLGLAVLLSGCAVVVAGPPALAIRVKPRLVVIADTGLYYAPDVSADLFFYGGAWYRFHQNCWFQAGAYSGPWARIQTVPQVFYTIPPGHAKHHCVLRHRGKPTPPPRPGHGRGRGRGR
jgi:hypothetical protein